MLSDAMLLTPSPRHPPSGSKAGRTRCIAWSAWQLLVLFLVVSLIGAVIWLYAVPSTLTKNYRPVASTTEGQISGRTNAKVTYFRGVPYATVNSRFDTAASPALHFDTTLDCGSYGPICPQRPFAGLNLSHHAQSESDCLTLNIAVPRASIPFPSQASLDDGSYPGGEVTLIPVAVFLHGGEYAVGSGAQSNYDCHAFANRTNVVCVTVNYRLGAFGFLTFDDGSGTGSVVANRGLNDQQIALDWINDNIASFGGDNTVITIWGQGTGANSALLHLAAPDSTGLFEQIIAESAHPPVTQPLPTAQMGLSRAAALAASAGCTGSNSKFDVMACLRALSAEQILDAVERANLTNGWGPVNDYHLSPASDAPLRSASVGGNGVFSFGDPSALFAAGTYPAVMNVSAILMGSNTNDAALPLWYSVGADHAPEVVTAQFTADSCTAILNRVISPYQTLAPWSVNSTLAILKFYNISSSVGSTPTQMFVACAQAVSDALYKCSSLTLGDWLVTGGDAEVEPFFINNTFIYSFGHHSSFPLPDVIPAYLGASFWSELPYVWGVPCLMDCAPTRRGAFTAYESSLSDLMITAFSNFLYNGDPATHQFITNSLARVPVPVWPFYTPDTFRETLRLAVPVDGFNQTASATNDPACQFWSSILA